MNDTESRPEVTKAALPYDVTHIRPPENSLSRQKLDYYVGISRETAPARHLAMNLVVVPPGASAEPHSHVGYETAIYLVQGCVETLYGDKLQHQIVIEAGDFLFIPPDVPHQAINRSETVPAIAVIARNDPDEQDKVVPYDPAP